MAGVLRTDRVRDISLLRKHVRCGTRLRLDGGEAATGTPDGSGGSTLANLLDQGSRFSGHADRGPLAIGGPLYVRTLAADALRLAEGQRAPALAAFGPYGDGRGRRIGHAATPIFAWPGIPRVRTPRGYARPSR
ncbi:hypothetical protein GCM10010503_02940 [Streptomyces lucensis JCM 4490]|uniref:Uncharacterized protein n=1 Tax=Streptomyces lucensis JCM 4490 TaxID=1306176 RepID=A0A918ISQ1_9ACTN|nr:hypothetical protein GCM10010503_02940 [Streptomyces lucensis JCM 4490]